MTSLQSRQEKIKTVKRSNSYQAFLKEVVSRYPLVMYKNQGLLSMYPETPRSCKNVTTEDFEQQRGDFVNRGITYDFSKDFFQNFKALYDNTPFPALYNYAGAENCDYAFSAYMSKNCYLSFTIITNCENVLYSFAVKENCKNVLNSSQVRNNSENIYMSTGIINAMNIFYSKYIYNSSDIWFSTNMMGCHHCILCDGLENQSYCIKNQEYSKDEYELKAQEILTQKESYMNFFMQLSHNGKNFASTNVDGDFVLKSQDVKDGYHSLEIKDGHNILMVGGSHSNTHMYDVFEAGAQGNTDFWGAINAGVKSDNVYNCEGIVNSSNVYYSRFLEGCSYCLGCIGLKNKQFCILNKQYSKEERHIKVDEIFAQMENDGILGLYFPATINPFYFNDTIASLVGDFDKEQIQQEGYLWREKEIKVDIPEGLDVVQVSELGEYESFVIASDGKERGDLGDTKIAASSPTPRNDEKKRHIDPVILTKIIVDEQGNYYRIVPMELEFLQKYKLPLPNIHRLERMRLGLRHNKI